MKKSNYKYRLVALLLFSLWSFSACHKEDDDINVKPNELSGTFSAFEAVVDGETISLPSAEEKIEVKIVSETSETAIVTVTYFYQDKPQASDPIDCTVEKDPDGFTFLKLVNTDETMVYYYDKNTIDLLVPNSGSTVSASRDGKKPDWWDD